MEKRTKRLTQRYSIEILSANSKQIMDFLDYFTIFELKYTCQFFYNKIFESKLDQVLDLRNIKIRDENNAIYNIIKKHKKLTTLMIEFRKINDTHIFQIKENITSINLNGCQNITDNGIIHIANNCNEMKRFEVYWNPNITDKGLKSILQNCLKLEFLNLSGCKKITNESLSLISKNLKHLKHLDLTRCVGVNDEFLLELINNARALTYLNLYALPYLKCQFFKELANHPDYPKLEFLDLCGNQNINDDLFLTLKDTNVFINLEYLNLSWCVNLTDKFTELLFDQFNNLKLISFHGLLGITDNTINFLSKNKNIISNLTTIDVYGCLNIQFKDNDYLLNIFPNLKEFRHHF